MKRIFLIMCTALMLASLSVPAMAQDTAEPPPVTAGFETFVALVAFIPLLTELLKKALPKASSRVNQIISWATGLVVTCAGWLFGLGFLAGMEWYIMLLYGLGASLAANGVFDTGLITWFVGLFERKKTPG